MKKYALLILSVFLWSCNATKKVVSVPKNNEVANVGNTSNKLFYNNINKKNAFSQVKINSKISAETGSFLPSIDAVIYIENGQKIWLNMSALFFNVARGLVTPEGIQGYEKWNKQYIESDFSYLNKLLNINFINYQSFQNLLLGKTFVPINDSDFQLINKNQEYLLISQKNQKVIANGKTTEYKINLDYASNFDLKKVILQEVNSSNALEVYYYNWASVEADRFPQSVKIIIKGEKNGQILIENTKFEFDKMQVPYSVPSNYKKVNIK